MTKTVQMTSVAVVLFLLGASQPANAALVTFDFNSLANGANSSTIQAYMNGVLLTNGGGTVTVGSGAVADRNTYIADGHIEGGNVGSPAQITLGNSEGCTINGPACVGGSVDTYLRNIGDTTSPNDRITMQFSNTITISSVSFDFEIFPDGSASQPPDFIFQALNGSNAIVTTWTKLGLAPGFGGTWTNSPSGAETNAQLMGHWDSGALVGVRTLNFIDWPATIGIDNLKVCINCTTTQATVPEPGSMLLLGTGIAGFFARRKKRQQA